MFILGQDHTRFYKTAMATKNTNSTLEKSAVFWLGLFFTIAVSFSCIFSAVVGLIVSGHLQESQESFFRSLALATLLWMGIYAISSKGLIQMLEWKAPPAKLRGFSAIGAGIGVCLILIAEINVMSLTDMEIIKRQLIALEVICAIYGIFLGIFQTNRIKASSAQSFQWALVSGFAWVSICLVITLSFLYIRLAFPIA